ncbi:hypothetical protein BC941DRAFT_410579 [Chlamydoabsidia padenii]|nr:hypothetical protein BC941DRAFT_410579 [Chlamydoabsidia padenii]
MTDFRPFSTPSPSLVFPAASPCSKLKCTPTRKPPLPIDWAISSPHIILFESSHPRLSSWIKIDNTLQQQQKQRQRKRRRRQQSTPEFLMSLYKEEARSLCTTPLSSSCSSSSSSFISSSKESTTTSHFSSLLPQDDTISIHHYQARFGQQKKKSSRFGVLVAKMKRAAERPFRLMDTYSS